MVFQAVRHPYFEDFSAAEYALSRKDVPAQDFRDKTVILPMSYAAGTQLRQ